MDKPTMFEPYRAAPEIDVLPSYFPIPGLGICRSTPSCSGRPSRSWWIPGLGLLSDEFMPQLASVIDPDELRWLWLTHDDQDHIGSLFRLLDEVPHLRVITTFLAVGKMSLFRPLPLDRVYLLNPGQSLSVGDRTLTAFRPPTYDSPETTGFYDPKSGACFSADCFGALMSEPVEDAAEIEPGDLRQGMITWTTVDSPWLHMVDIARFKDTLDRVQRHVPEGRSQQPFARRPWHGRDAARHLAAVPATTPFIGPDQPAFEAMLAKMAAQ